jgi:ribonucleoside-diphosphate reductase subunit M1
MKMKIPYESDKALLLNEKIFETIYLAALVESNNLAKKYGPYETFKGSPASEGKLQFDLWNQIPLSYRIENGNYPKYDWNELKNKIKKHGLRNSLVTALMPTASTS